MSNGTVYLLYHELQVPGRPLCDEEPGYVRYVVPATEFRDQLAHLRQSGFRGLSVTEALTDGDRETEAVCLTFDDGCETDLTVAAPLLREKEFNATFYVTVAHLGRRGYLTERQLRDLSDEGFEIGCHSMNHIYLTDLSRERLETEIKDSKDRLEQLTGREVLHFSCPGGRWDERIARLAQEAGYNTVATSRIGVNAPGANHYRLSRVAVKRGIGVMEFDRLCRSQGLRLRQAQGAMLDAAKRVLGNKAYEKIRASVLGQRSEAAP